MNNKFKLSQPFIIILLTVAMLFLLTVFKSGFSVGSFTFKPVNILSDVIVKPKPAALISTIPKEKIELTKKELKLIKRGKLNRDSLMLVLQKDVRISDYRTDSLDILGRFFSTLNECEHTKKRVRIAWFGDSMIEGDLITSTVAVSCKRNLEVAV